MNMAGPGAAATQRTTPDRRPLWRDPVPWLVLAAVLAADQLSKALVIANLHLSESVPATGFFRFTHTWNTGTAFGLFRDYGGVLTVVSFVAVAVLYLFYRSSPTRPLLMRVAFGMQLGGAFGNLIDRLRLGHVTDFIDVGPWPVFNLADSSIVVGIVLMAYYFLVEQQKPRGSGQVPGLGSDAPGSQA
jgi:signal peptidase II